MTSCGKVARHCPCSELNANIFQFFLKNPLWLGLYGQKFVAEELVWTKTWWKNQLIVGVVFLLCCSQNALTTCIYSLNWILPPRTEIDYLRFPFDGQSEHPLRSSVNHIALNHVPWASWRKLQSHQRCKTTLPKLQMGVVSSGQK